MKSLYSHFLLVLCCLGAIGVSYGQNDSLSIADRNISDSLLLADLQEQLNNMSRKEIAEDTSSWSLIERTVELGEKLGDTISLISNLRKKFTWLIDKKRKAEGDSIDQEIKFLQASYGYRLKDTYANDEGFVKYYNEFQRSFWVFVDSTGALPFDSIESGSVRSLFKTNNISSNELRRKYAYWIKIRLRSEEDEYKEYFLMPNQEDENWESTTFYRPGLKGGWIVNEGGLVVPPEERVVKNWRDMFPIGIETNGDFYVYFRLKGYSYYNNPRTKGIFFQQISHTFRQLLTELNTRAYIFIGILGFQFVFFLLWYFATKESSFIPYLAYILGIVAIALFSIKFRYWFPDPNFDRLNVATGADLLFSWISGASLVLFTKIFLRSAKGQALWEKVFNVFLIIFSLLGQFLFWMIILLHLNWISEDSWFLEFLASNYGYIGSAYIFFFGIGILLIVINGITAFLKGFKPAKYYLIAIFFLLMGVGFSAFVSAFNINVSFLESYGGTYPIMQLGIILQLCFFALGMGNRRRILEKEKIETQNKLVETQKKLIEEQNKVNTAFGRFVPHKFLEAIGRDSVLDIKLGDGVEREVTVFFSDIRGYTRLAEQMAPKENFQFLNGYLGRLGPVISSHQGFVNQYYGDGIMAIFMNESENALKGSLDIQKRLHNYNEERMQKGRIPIKIGIGMHTGPLIMGVIGDTLRMEAGVVSDTVNTAARMEGLTKYYGANILISETVFKGIKDPSAYLYRYLGKVQVKGRIQPLKVYDFFGADRDEIIERKKMTMKIFDQGVRAYYEKDFVNAVSAFEQVLADLPEDKTSENYLMKSKTLQLHGAPEGWNGVEEMKVK